MINASIALILIHATSVSPGMELLGMACVTVAEKIVHCALLIVTPALNAPRDTLKKVICNAAQWTIAWIVVMTSMHAWNALTALE